MKFISALGVQPTAFKQQMDGLTTAELLHLGDAFKQEAARRGLSTDEQRRRGLA